MRISFQLIGRNQLRRADLFIENYHGERYIIYHDRAEKFSHERSDKKNIFHELTNAINSYEGSKFTSAAGEPFEPTLMLLLSWMSEAISYGMIVSKDNRRVDMDSGGNFRAAVKVFLAKLSEVCNLIQMLLLTLLRSVEN